MPRLCWVHISVAANNSKEEDTVKTRPLRAQMEPSKNHKGRAFQSAGVSANRSESDDTSEIACGVANHPAPFTIRQLLRFFVPGLLGVALFLMPMSVDGHFTVLIALLIDYVNTVVKPLMIPVVVALATLSGLLTLVVGCSVLSRLLICTES